jgi:hypothetical protein
MAKEFCGLWSRSHGSFDAECYCYETLLADRHCSQAKGSGFHLRSFDCRSRKAPTLAKSNAEDQPRLRAIVDRRPYTLPAKQREMPLPAWNPIRGLATIPSQHQNTEDDDPSCMLPTQMLEKEDATMSTKQHLSCG